MDELLKRARDFQRQAAAERREQLERLTEIQKPHTLFISCSDSRVLPSLIAGADPGDLFQLRTIANIVPPYSDSEAGVEARAAIEFAVEVLQVRRIVVCGHSNCGGCAALYGPDPIPDSVPGMHRWASVHNALVGQVQDRVTRSGGEADALTSEQAHGIIQLENLLEYPAVAARVNAGKLELMGLFYLVGEGRILLYDNAAGRFQPLE